MKIALDEGAILPTRAHPRDAGLDIYAMKDGIVRAHGSAEFGTGVLIQLPPDTMGDMRPRSGLMFNADIISLGTIDESYDGEIRVKLFNLSGDDYAVKRGDRITQLVVVSIVLVDPEPVPALPQGEGRGSAGFGSTGR